MDLGITRFILDTVAPLISDGEKYKEWICTSLEKILILFKLGRH